MKNWLKLAYSADFESDLQADYLSDKWFPKAMRRKEFASQKILDVAKYRDYVKLKKITRVVNEINDYTRENGLEPGKVNILEVGCGKGIYCLALARLGYKVCGIDLNEYLISQAQNRCGQIANLQFIHSDAEAYLEATHAAFKVVLMLDVLEHVPSPDLVCRAVQKRLVPGGFALIIVPNGYDVAELLYLAPYRIMNKIKKVKEPEGAPHCQKLTIKNMKSIVSQAGFKWHFLSSIYTTFFPFILLLLLGRRSWFAYLNILVADKLPPSITGSWLIKAEKNP